MAMRKFKKGNLICYSNIFILEIKTKRYVYSTLNYYEIIPIAAIDKDYNDKIIVLSTKVGDLLLCQTGGATGNRGIILETGENNIDSEWLQIMI
jgi:hypothetical protein